VGLHYSNPAKNQYKYQLEGFDENWVDAGTRRTATYTNLAPDEYTFRVQASNADGVWNTEGATLTLTVLPPWYRTWWAYGLFALLLAGFIYGGDRFQRRRLAVKEEERAALREAELRAEEENKRRSDTEQLSKIGRTITSTLSVDEIIQTTYENVNELMDAEVFGVGILNREKNRLEFPATTEKGKILKPYSHQLDDEKIVIGDYEKEYRNYISKIADPIRGENPESIIYLPLVHKGETIGVLTTQSFEKNAYSEYHITLLQNLANYAAIALDNASAYRRLNKTLEDLKSVQTQLVQQEKLASLGQLTAGIAHEIKNPLNFVNNFSDLSLELVEEIREEVKRQKAEGNSETSNVKGEKSPYNLILDILDDIEMNLKTIHKHGSRADSIVKSMLQHSRGGDGTMEPTSLNPLIKEYVNLSFHGMRAGRVPINVDIDLQLDNSVGDVPLIAEDFSRVIVNLCNNAFDAMREKTSSYAKASEDNEQGADKDLTGFENLSGLDDYQPKLTVRTQQKHNNVTIEVEDNGPGIPDEMKDKIMQPFFTTKKGTEGTGLGLSITNDIIKAHGGVLNVKSDRNGTTFSIILNS
ncbi:MAG: GAF domain-containing protein, partial [Bacteroidetes bacterium]|jgi:signal transduction histidine kinase|nr:GAF domain-containing protein [Bacteroidota bacterium]